MPLSARARSYLATLRREPAVSTERVAEALSRECGAAYPAWTAFHERYAGYVDPLGCESAVLGLMHDSPYWLPAGDVWVHATRKGFSVTCAEVHPSFDYRLDADGSFRSYGGGGPCESFDVKVEQDAVIWDARRDGRAWKQLLQPRITAAGLAALRASAGAERVPEASDRFGTCWRSRAATWLERAGASPIMVVAVSEERSIEAILASA